MLSAEFVHQTERAYCLRFSEDGPDVWVPKSCVTDITEGTLTKGEKIDIEIKGWFCEKEGLV